MYASGAAIVLEIDTDTKLELHSCTRSTSARRACAPCGCRAAWCARRACPARASSSRPPLSGRPERVVRDRGEPARGPAPSLHGADSRVDRHRLAGERASAASRHLQERHALARLEARRRDVRPERLARPVVTRDAPCPYRPSRAGRAVRGGFVQRTSGAARRRRRPWKRSAPGGVARSVSSRREVVQHQAQPRAARSSPRAPITSPPPGTGWLRLCSGTSEGPNEA